MNNDDRIDEIIRNAASDYNRPPATPRDEMWTAIQAAQTTAAAGPQLHVIAGGAAKRPLGGYTTTHRKTHYTWAGLAAAAVLLVATGVGIGRWTSSPVNGTLRVADAPGNSVPNVKGDGEVTPDNEVTPGVEVSSPVEALAENPGNTTPQSPATTRTREQIRQEPRVVGNGSVTPLPGNPQPAFAGQSGGVQAVTYQLATEQHLQDAEALLTSFSLESRDERMNSQFAGWAKGLLSNTRLLLDSPAGDDPRRAKLLQDLELVLAQIVQLSPDAPVAERELVQGSIQNGMVMTRLRTAIPAGQPREITER